MSIFNLPLRWEFDVIERALGGDSGSLEGLAWCSRAAFMPLRNTEAESPRL